MAALATPETVVVLELMTMVLEFTAYLGALLPTSPSPAASPQQGLVAEIRRCCDRVIATLRAGGGNKRKAVQYEGAAAASLPPPPPPQKRSRGGEEALRVVTSGTTVDGCIWRKYGRKEISGCKHPRLYYRCAYRRQGCTATRRVQRAHEDGEPAAYEIAYYGEHACRGAIAACQGRPPPAVVDYGSNAWAGVGTVATPAASERQPLSCDAEVVSSSQGGWSSEAGFEAHTTHQWHDAARVEVGEPGATPCYAADPVTEFLDGCFDWASVINQPFDVGDLHHLATPQ